MEFFDAGNNLLIAGDIDSTKPFRQIFNNLGVELDEIVIFPFFFKIFTKIKKNRARKSMTILITQILTTTL